MYRLDEVDGLSLPKQMKVFRWMDQLPTRNAAEEKDPVFQSRGYILAAKIHDAPVKYTGRTLRWESIPACDALFELAEEAAELGRFVFADWKLRSKQRREELPVSLTSVEVPMCEGISPVTTSLRLQVFMTCSETNKMIAIQRACIQSGAMVNDKPVCKFSDVFRYLLQLFPDPKISNEGSQGKSDIDQQQVECEPS